MTNVIERAQKAYESEVLAHPNYHDGGERPSWGELSEIARWSWLRPTAYAVAKEGK